MTNFPYGHIVSLSISGEERQWERVPFTVEKISLACSISDQASGLIDRLQTLEAMRLREGLTKARNEISTLQNIPEILRSIADGVRKTLNCDLVILYIYNEEKDEIDLPTVSGDMSGPVQIPGAFEYMDRNSIVWKLLRTREVYVTSDAKNDPLMLSPFVLRENIASSAGIPLIIGEKSVGVLFAHYHFYHPFSAEETNIMHLFASQAAVAINNATMTNGDKVVTPSIEFGHKQILEKILKQAFEITGNKGQKAVLCTIHLVDEKTNDLVLEYVYPTDIIQKLRTKVGDRVVMKNENNKKGIAGRAVITRRSQLVSNVTVDPDYINFQERTKSILAVPLLYGGLPIGVLTLQSDKTNAFDKDDEKALQAFANTAVVTLKNTERVVRKGVHTNSVLIVDNDQDYLETLKEFLEIEFSVSSANNPKQALQIIQRQKPPFQVVITDLRLLNDDDERDESGLDLLKKIKRRGDNTQTILLTSFPTYESARKALGEYSAFDYVSKSSGIEALRETVYKAAHAASSVKEDESIPHAKGDQHDVLLGKLQKYINDQEVNKPIIPPLSSEEGLETLIRERLSPLSSEEGLETILVDELIREQLSQLQENASFQNILVNLHLAAANAKVKVSPEWFRRVLDILIDNASSAMSSVENKKLIIKSTLIENSVEISITDSGEGIPSNLQEKIFKKPVEKIKGSKGAGIGLLMAEAIMQTYHGGIKLANTSSEGTTIVVSLPIVD